MERELPLITEPNLSPSSSHIEMLLQEESILLDLEEDQEGSIAKRLISDLLE